jgi:hypothetical protein
MHFDCTINFPHKYSNKVGEYANLHRLEAVDFVKLTLGGKVFILYWLVLYKQYSNELLCGKIRLSVNAKSTFYLWNKSFKPRIPSIINDFFVNQKDS